MNFIHPAARHALALITAPARLMEYRLIATATRRMASVNNLRQVQLAAATGTREFGDTAR